MRYEPLADRVIITPAGENKVSAGGLIIPDVATNQKHVAYGTVLSVGHGRANAEGTLVPLHVKVGDIVCFPRRAPAMIPVIDAEGNEEIVLMLREAEIIAIVHDMPQPSLITDVRGAPLSIMPRSFAKADSSYENEDAIAVAEREGWADINEHQDQPE
jgi:chaperonin GroES